MRIRRQLMAWMEAFQGTWRRMVAWLDDHNAIRMTLWIVAVVVSLYVLMKTNDNVSDGYHLLFVQPFLIMGAAALLKVVWYLAQAPGPRHTEPWWAFWRWVEMPMVAMVVFLIPISVYGFTVWAEFSGRFDPPDWPRDVARMVMWVAGIVVICIVCELLWRMAHPRKQKGGKIRNPS